ncbi:MAG: substrate-binding domain-containing protein [Gammaproteobacteria bacterium]
MHTYSRVLLALAALLTIMTAPALAAQKDITWVGCGISKRGFMEDLAAAYKKRTGVVIHLEGGGATKGLRDVSSGKSDLGGSCRLPLVHHVGEGNVSVDPAERHVKIIPMGWDALVVIVHKDNHAVKSISLQQLRDVLTGKITDWKQLGANLDHPINLYLRKGKISGVGLTLRQQLFNNADQNFTSHATILASSGKIEKAVEKDPYALAVSGISSSRHRQVRILGLNGIDPTMANLKAGKYLLYRILFLVAPPDYTQRPELKGFVDFALSMDGQNVIEKAGTLPYNKGIGLLRTGASLEYLLTLDAIDRDGLYTLGGH